MIRFDTPYGRVWLVSMAAFTVWVASTDGWMIAGEMVTSTFLIVWGIAKKGQQQ